MSRPPVPSVDVDRIERLEAAYNRVDRQLREVAGVGDDIPFGRLVTMWAKGRRSRWEDARLLRLVAKVRNVIVHQQLDKFRYPATPSAWLVDELERLRSRWERPEKVIPVYQRKVVTLEIGDSLAAALELIRQHEFSQFPVYSGNRFRGLLTENGIARWLSASTASETLVDFDDACVRAVLKSEEERDNCQFIPRETLVDDVFNTFTSNPLLEAVLITQNGKRVEKLLGIITRWNILQAHNG